MLKNYLLITLRNIRKQKLYSFINLTGLATGIAACLIIFLFIRDEKSFDAFHKKNGIIYRLCEVQSFPGTLTQNVALSMPAMGPHMWTEFPEITSFTRYFGGTDWIFNIGEKAIKVPQLARVDSTFLQIFDFELITGDKTTALNDPYSILITEVTAIKFFGTTEVLGRQVARGEDNYQITGILKNVPENSHLQFDALISMSSITSQSPEFNDRWGSNYLVTYFIIPEGTNLEAMAERFPEFLVSKMGDEITELYQLYLQPLSQVHLGSIDTQHDYRNYRKFDGKYISIFMVLAGFVLLIAGINFMNLSIYRSVSRSKEVGLRKSLGAQKTQLVAQFIGESVIFSCLALVTSLAITALLIPSLNLMTGRTMDLASILTEPFPVLALLGITFLVGLLAGVYPAFYVSTFNPATVLKGGSSSSKQSVFKSGLVVFQFALAIGMIAGTFITLNQLRYMKNKDLGFDKSRIVLIPASQESDNKYRTIYNEFKNLPGVDGVTATGQRLGNNLHQWSARAKNEEELLDITISQVNVDKDFLEVYDIELLDGRTFTDQIHSDTRGQSFLINEKLAKELGWENPVGTQLGFSGVDSIGTVIGVVKNFNYNSLHYDINTLGIYMRPDWGYDEISVKIKAGAGEEVFTGLKKIWDQNVSDRPFEYSYLDEHFLAIYRADTQVTKVVASIATLAILIAMLGLFGLSALSTLNRIKEVGIRKVLGASGNSLLMLLTNKFTLLILSSFIIAAPVTYFFMNGWLENFAFRIEITFAPFLVAALISFLVAFITVGYHAIKALSVNPTDILRYE
jgi:putative ABC transport system permease protein